MENSNPKDFGSDLTAGRAQLRPDPKIPDKPTSEAEGQKNSQTEIGLGEPRRADFSDLENLAEIPAQPTSGIPLQNDFPDKLTPAPNQPDTPDKKPRVGIIVLLVIIGIIILGLIYSIIFAKPRIIIQNLPTGAQIFFDGKETVKTTITTTAGIHYLKISQAGYTALDKSFDLSYFKKIQQDANLRPIPQAQQIVSQEIFSLDQDNKNVIYYLDNSNKTINQLKFSPNQTNVIKTALTPTMSQEINGVIFSPDFSLAILKLKNGETGLYDFARYDLLHQEYTPWGNNIGAVVWRPQTDKIIYWQTIGQKKAITQADKKNSDPQNLIFLDDYDITPSPQLDISLDGKTLLIVADGNLYLFDLESKKAPSAAAEKNISNARFAPNSKTIAFTQDKKLKTVDFERKETISPDPQKIGQFSIFPEKNLGVEANAQIVIFSPDSQKIIAYLGDKGLTEINIADGQSREFSYQNKENLKIDSFQISFDENLLYFLTEDKNLMALKLDKGEY
ncbi:MAG: Uncharacterized protein CEN89_766 [Candidatus Berkelbacteria bacterium Licking1014_7]|uniref:PEGA domain-containing protein n=1 Tax=Candidatus Berkelbacteria bacterium Licking1014_7 TaxID=2017147 RepID=A0A554LHG2_9BACT|nr:MAG: Uncharacterized protein CEN89_766 [Candidatus Berkelbacteria bacterium Licking1014_7]